jgi:hypothetical protein
MAIKWIITDIDGCLSPEESIAWDLDAFFEFARMSREASEGRGPLPPFTLCTGRPQPYVEPLIKILDIRAPAICENGAVFYTLSDNRSRFGPGVTEEKIIGLRAIRAYIDSELLPKYPELVYQFGKEAHLSVYCENPKLLERITPLLREFAQKYGGPQPYILPTHYYLNISMEGVNKGRALEKLLQDLGVNKAEVAGIGDTEGDMPLRDAVGFFACPSNSKPALKEAADYVSPYPDIRGLLDILDRPEMRK